MNHDDTPLKVKSYILIIVLGTVSITTYNHNLGIFLVIINIIIPLVLLEVLSIGTVLVVLYSLSQDLAALSDTPCLCEPY